MTAIAHPCPDRPPAVARSGRIDRTARTGARLVRLICAVAMTTLGLATAAAAQQSLRIAAIVNDDVISVYDLQSRIALVLASSGAPDTPESRRRLAPQVLRGLIDEKLKMQEAKRLDIKVTEADINRAIAEIERQNRLPKGGIEAQLGRVGVPLSELIGQITPSIAWARVLNRQFRPQIQIGEEEIDEVLAEINQNMGQPETRVAEIQLAVDDPRNEGEVRAAAERLHQQAQAKPDRFASFALNFSQSASAGVGGDLGWVRPGQLGEPFDSQIAALKPGQVSPLIRSPAGFHILYVIERRLAEGVAGAELTLALHQLFQPLPANATQPEVGDAMERLRALAVGARSCPDLEAVGRRMGSGMSGSLGKVNPAKLPAEIRSVVTPLAVGTVSQPIRVANGVLVLMVCEREGGTAAPAVRERIRENLLTERLAAADRRHLRDLRRTAFVDIRL